MEKGEAWGQSENLTMAVGRLLEAIDAERLALAAAFGLKVRTMREHYSLTYGVPDAPLGETSRMLAETQPTTPSARPPSTHATWKTSCSGFCRSPSSDGWPAC